MTISTAVEPVRPSDEAAAKRGERRALGVACGAHMLHDGYTDLVWVALPIWQAEFGLNYAMVGLLRTIYSGTLASLQIPAAAIAARIAAGTVLSAGTALAGLCYCLAGLSSGFVVASIGAASGRGWRCNAASDRFGAGDARVQRGRGRSRPSVLTISPATSVKSYCPRQQQACC